MLVLLGLLLVLLLNEDEEIEEIGGVEVLTAGAGAEACVEVEGLTVLLL